MVYQSPEPALGASAFFGLILSRFMSLCWADDMQMVRGTKIEVAGRGLPGEAGGAGLDTSRDLLEDSQN